MRYTRKTMTSQHRRQLLLQGLALAWMATGCAGAAEKASRKSSAARFAEIEARADGRLGLMAIDTGSGRQLGFNAEQRFALCSTFKLPLAAMVLAQVQSGALQLEQKVPISAADLVAYAPVVSAQLANKSMSLEALCEAAVGVSDNAAANLLLKLIGGPLALTAYLRRQGDGLTRLDRTEPTLNSNLPGDPRDTTTPRVMAHLLQTLFSGPALAPPMRERLERWCVESRTGVARLRAGVPSGWRVGDKTGTGERGAVNDVAIVWPPGRPPWVVACYLSDSTLPLSQLNAAHEQAMRVVVVEFGSTR